MKKQITVLSYGDNPLVSTGYGMVWNNLLSRWAKMKPNWKFMHVGWQGRDRMHQTREGYWQLPMAKQEMGTDTIVSNLMKYQPEILLTLADVGKQGAYIQAIYEAKKRGWRGKWLAYTPVDTHQWAIHWDGIFDAPDLNIAMSQFGELQFSKYNVKNLTMIPHGVDTKVFYPKDIKDVKEKFDINNKFVIGYVGRNQIRKMIAYWLRGFANFAKDKEDVVLLLHTDMNPPAGEGRGWALDALIWKYEQETKCPLFQSKKIMLTRTNLDLTERQQVSFDDMNEIYNMMDLFLFPTGGEGFGLPAVECQAAGTPIIMTANTTAPELVSKSGDLIKVLKDKYGRQANIIGTNGVENNIPDDKHVEELLNKYYKLWKEKKLKAISEKARKFALTYDWDIIAKQWLDLFENEI